MLGESSLHALAIFFFDTQLHAALCTQHSSSSLVFEALSSTHMHTRPAERQSARGGGQFLLFLAIFECMLYADAGARVVLFVRSFLKVRLRVFPSGCLLCLVWLLCVYAPAPAPVPYSPYIHDICAWPSVI